MEWSSEQDAALARGGSWMGDSSDPAPWWYLGGYAGTGKTTLAKHLVANATGKWLFAAYTGKASHVMRQKGCTDAQTIHSLIYRPAGESRKREIEVLQLRVTALQLKNPPTQAQREELHRLKQALATAMEENRPRFEPWANSPLTDPEVDGIVIDECSMVDGKMAEDLLSFGKKVLVLGDPAQLPPVGSSGYFTHREPDVMLTQVHRQAQDSGILRLATLVREGGDPSRFAGTQDCRVWRSGAPKEDVRRAATEADQILVGRNATRHDYNARFRQLDGRATPFPEIGDRLICLKNNRDECLLNGMQFRVLKDPLPQTEPDGLVTEMGIESLDDGLGTTQMVTSWAHHFVGRENELDAKGYDRRDLREFDFAYAITVHKSQGSQWRDVLLFDESGGFRGDARSWLYTGITRAAERLTVCL